jgi:DNA-binding winged helix-turn-helix (wHTH) protein
MPTRGGKDREASERIELAHLPDFRIGRLLVRPSVRQLVGDDGASEILEPRVMQVMVALARAEGGIVSRAQLSQSCWENRIVGDDAINRVISRLRRSAEGIGRGSFGVETITKVGYRLIAAGDDMTTAVSPSSATDQETAATWRPTRRQWIAGAALGTAGGGLALFGLRRKATPAADDQEAQLQQGLGALMRDTRESQNEAMGLLRQLVGRYPGFADGWGALAMTYAFSAHWRSWSESQSFRTRARAAAARGLALDRGNAYADVAVALALPARGNWLVLEQALKRGLARRPGDRLFITTLALLMQSVGRAEQAVQYDAQPRGGAPLTPDDYYRGILGRWMTDRLEETDRLIAEARQSYPTQFALWFAQFFILIYSGRAHDALILLDDEQGRPSGIPAVEFARVRLLAVAMASGRAADADRAMHEWLPLAHQGSGHAEIVMQFAAAIGRLDTAFAIADAYYFGRDFAVPDVRFTVEQGSYTPLAERVTYVLFFPSTKTMRADRRFEALVTELGLEAYWKAASVIPDYRRGR